MKHDCKRTIEEKCKIISEKGEWWFETNVLNDDGYSYSLYVVSVSFCPFCGKLLSEVKKNA